MKTVPIKTYYLQMHRPPDSGSLPPMEGVEVARVEQPTIGLYRFLYDSVGRDWNWVDRKLASDEELLAIIHHDLVEIYVLEVDGGPAGFCELDRRVDGQIELAYFGLMPEFIGRGLGKHFLHWILRKAWTYAPRRVWLHTCELDHEAALPLYRQAGFVVYDERVVDQTVL